MNKKVLSLLQYLFFLGLGIFLVWWSLQKIPDKDWADIKNAFRNANYRVVVPVIIILLLSHYSRAVRWKILMDPLGYKPRMSNTYFAVLIGYMSNLAVPRLGEVLKCTILARYEKVPADKLVGTIVAERAFDVLCLAIVMAITFFTQVDVIGGFMSEKLADFADGKKALFTGTRLIILAAVILLIVAAAILVFRKFAHIGLIRKIKAVLKGVWHGITSIRYLKNKGWFIFHTIFIWSMYLLSVQIGFLAMRETTGYGVKEALSALTTGSFAMIVPTPGGSIGVYPIFVGETLSLYGLKEGLGIAFGGLMWGVQFFQMLLSGFVAMLLLPYINKRKTHAQG